MNKKGQASIEFLFLVSIAMIYLSTVVLPSVELAKSAADDVTGLGQTRMAAEKLANAIDSVAAASGEARQTITLLVPARGEISCEANSISFNFKLLPGDPPVGYPHPSCTAGTPANTVCNKTFSTITAFNCSQPTVGAMENDYSTTVEAKIEKTGGVTNVSFS